MEAPEVGHSLAKTGESPAVAVNPPGLKPIPAPAPTQPPTAGPPPEVNASAPPAATPQQATANQSDLSGPSGYPRPARTPFEIQVALARHLMSPGSIDGRMGPQTRAALAAYKTISTVNPDKGPGSAPAQNLTLKNLELDMPALTNYIVTSNDLDSLQPMGTTWLAKSRQTSLAYETELELIGEKAHSSPVLIRKLNPGVNWSGISPGAEVKIPDVTYPDPESKAAFVVIHLGERFLEAFDSQSNLMAHFPCSIAAKVEKRPVGELHVIVVAPHPNYTVNPDLFPESSELQALGHKLILPPGPNNPVGVAWIGLDRPGYGIHGTPNPEEVGRTESHGCFRLANWDAEYMVKLAWLGMPVEVVP